jgi:16S rRNA (cytosine967-C5)-methyltransferase
VQTLPPGDSDTLAGFEGRMDLVLVDAPCSGTGVWRRRPDAKWRLTPVQLLERQAQQRALLEMAAPLVKPGGTLAYVTCSLLPRENDQQIEAFLESDAGFSPLDVTARAANALSRPIQSRLQAGKPGLLLTPARHGTDGFYIALLARQPL